MASSFFVDTRGTRLNVDNIPDLRRTLDAAEIAVPPGRRRLRVHDLRYSFAVVTLLASTVMSATSTLGRQCCRPDLAMWIHVDLLALEEPSQLVAGAGQSRASIRGAAPSAVDLILEGFFTDKLIPLLAQGPRVRRLPGLPPGTVATHGLIVQILPADKQTPATRSPVHGKSAELRGSIVQPDAEADHASRALRQPD
ncbi:hypothetical protein [Rhodococcus koreensis]|uniref:hypothetical protein n=1 Tax=Rhodococcus koreensis TaxID=99653 RepID=UPI00366AC4F0